MRTERHISYIKDKNIYNRIYMEYKRDKWDTKYFTLWNQWLILPSDLDESRIFTYQDIYYIKKMNENMTNNI